jgi:hypothetical protein
MLGYIVTLMQHKRGKFRPEERPWQTALAYVFLVVIFACLGAMLAFLIVK